MTQPPSLPIEFRAKKSKLILPIIICAVFAVIGIAMIISGEYIKGGAVFIFFGPGTGLLVWQYRKEPLLFTFTERGIEFNKAIMEWTNIAELNIISMYANKFLAVIPYDTEVIYAQLGPTARKISKASESMCGSPWSMPISDLAVKPDVLIDWITYFSQKAQSERGGQ